jgi:probable addiction module antidote protein
MTARDTAYADDLARALTDPTEAAAFLDAVSEFDDADAMLLALRQVAQAHGMAEVARRAELGDKTLFKTLAEGGNPTLATLLRLLPALGVRLAFKPC